MNIFWFFLFLFFLQKRDNRTMNQMLAELPEPVLNSYRFRSEVERPASDMLEKFPAHPDMIIGKLVKFIEKENNR